MRLEKMARGKSQKILFSITCKIISMRGHCVCIISYISEAILVGLTKYVLTQWMDTLRSKERETFWPWVAWVTGSVTSGGSLRNTSGGYR